jgi:hypothetical protein
MSKDKPIERDELLGALLLVFLFISVVGGRAVGNYYASYQEMTKLKILFEVTEEDLSNYIVNEVQGQDTNLEVGLVITGQRADNPANVATSTPDYIKRWLVGLTVSPLVVNQPEASDVELEMLIEGNVINDALYSFPKQTISYYRYTDRTMKLNIGDKKAFKQMVNEAATKYGGEIEVTFKGKVHMYLLFLDTWLPFTVTRYPVVSIPYLEYLDSGWRSYTSGAVSSLSVNEGGYVQVDFHNPTRMHSLSEDVTCQIFKQGEDTPVMNVTKKVQIAPDTDGQYVFPFTLSEPGDYTYRLVAENRVLTETSLVLSVR